MKFSSIDDEYTIYLNNYIIRNIDFFDNEELEKYINYLFNKLKKIYNIVLNGYYNIDIYIDNNYGAIINIKKDDIEYYDYFSDQIDTQIIIHNNSNFLYKVKDFLDIKNNIQSNFSLYKYYDELYIKLNDKIDENKLGFILEYCEEICYDIEKIIQKNNLLFCSK